MSQHQQTIFTDHKGDSVIAIDGVHATLMAKESSACSHDLKALCEAFYDAAICKDPNVIVNLIQTSRRDGTSVYTILTDVVPAVARMLGEAWEDDLISFVANTLGCIRLQSVVLGLPNDKKKPVINSAISNQSVLVMVPKGGQHTLGATVLAKQIRLYGIDVKLELEASDASLSEMALTQNFDAVMISASKGLSVSNLRQLVAQARRKWKTAKIIIGGGILDHGIDLVTATGTDYVTNDWQGALGL